VTPGSGGLQSVLPLAKAGYVADLSKRAWATKIPLATSARPLYWQGAKLYAVPIDVVPVGVLYHPDLLTSLGLKVPTTMKQFLSACATAKSKGKSFLNVAGASAQNAGLLAVEIAGATCSPRTRNGMPSGRRARSRSRGRPGGGRRCSGSST